MQIISQLKRNKLEGAACMVYQIKSNQFISEKADSKKEIQDNDNVQPLTEVRKGCCQR